VFRQGKAPAASSQICAESASGKGINYSAQKLFRSIGGLSPVPFKHPGPFATLLQPIITFVAFFSFNSEADAFAE
jgi:hypothetical protein